MFFLRCKHWAAHSDRSFSFPSALSARAASMKSSSAARASETMPKSGPHTRPIWVGRSSVETGDLDEEAAGVGLDAAAPRHDQRPLGSVHHLESTLGLRSRRRRL